jgi:hypothetical protein
MLLAGDGERNIHRLREIREKAANMPAVQAIDRLLALEQGETTGVLGSARAHHGPGVTIVIHGLAESQDTTDQRRPVSIEHDVDETPGAAGDRDALGPRPPGDRPLDEPGGKTGRRR